MRLTVFSDYTLRVLIYLGLRSETRSTIAEIADAYGISKNHLMKVVHHLATRGYVETTRGKGGGLRLQRPPREINIGTVVRVTEQDTALVECFEPGSSCCRIEQACALKGVFHRALEAFFRVLDDYTLGDLLEPHADLQEILMPSRRKRS